jgi:hypothetical protein
MIQHCEKEVKISVEIENFILIQKAFYFRETHVTIERSCLKKHFLLIDAGPDMGGEIYKHANLIRIVEMTHACSSGSYVYLE